MLGDDVESIGSLFLIGYEEERDWEVTRGKHFVLVQSEEQRERETVWLSAFLCYSRVKVSFHQNHLRAFYSLERERERGLQMLES